VRPGRTKIPDDKALPQIERLLDAAAPLFYREGVGVGTEAL